jgi:hypothetical protein
MGKNWWLIPAAIVGYILYKKYVLSQTFSVFFKNIDFSQYTLAFPIVNLVIQVNNPTNVTAEIQNIKGVLVVNGQEVGQVLGITPTVLQTGSSLVSIPVTLNYTGVADLILNYKTDVNFNFKFNGSIMVDYITLPLNFGYPS